MSPAARLRPDPDNTNQLGKTSSVALPSDPLPPPPPTSPPPSFPAPIHPHPLTLFLSALSLVYCHSCRVSEKLQTFFYFLFFKGVNKETDRQTQTRRDRERQTETETEIHTQTQGGGRERERETHQKTESFLCIHS